MSDTVFLPLWAWVLIAIVVVAIVALARNGGYIQIEKANGRYLFKIVFSRPAKSAPASKQLPGE